MICEPDVFARLFQLHEAVNELRQPVAETQCWCVLQEARQIRGYFETSLRYSRPLSIAQQILLLEHLRTLINSLNSWQPLARGACRDLIRSSARELLTGYCKVERESGELTSNERLLPEGYVAFRYCGLRKTTEKFKRELKEQDVHRELQAAVASLCREVFTNRDALPKRRLNLLILIIERAGPLIADADPFGDRALARLFISIDFNHILFLSWYQEQVYARIRRFSSSSERLNVILSELEEIRSIPSQAGFSSYACNLSARAFLSGVLEEEFRRAVIGRMVNTEKEKGKLALNLSVAEIACLLRLLHGGEVFRVENTRELLRFAVGSFRSKRQGDFSFGNLSKEYYGVTQSTAALLRHLLQQMLNEVNRSFFPALIVLLPLSRLFSGI